MIEHTPIACLEPSLFPEVGAGITSRASVQHSRVYFKAHQYPDWYYVQMAAAEMPKYQALLPRPLPGTQRVDYYIYAVDSQVQISRTDEYDPEVAKKTCQRVRGVGTTRVPRITLHGTREGQPAVPPGFDKEGIVAFVTVAGLTLSGSALTGSGGTAVAGASGGTGGGGLSTGAILGLTGGAVAAGTVGAVALRKEDQHKQDPLEVDDDGDGLSENQGDCNDGNRDVRPGGAVTAVVSDTYSGGTVMCSQPREVAISVSNRSCATVAVLGMVGCGESVSSTCPSGPLWPQPWCRDGWPPVQSVSVAPGSTQIVATWSVANAMGGACVRRTSCTHTQRRWYVVHTSVGDLRAEGQVHTIDISDCPIC
jgi:hypothetical protein